MNIVTAEILYCTIALSQRVATLEDELNQQHDSFHGRYANRRRKILYGHLRRCERMAVLTLVSHYRSKNLNWLPEPLRHHHHTLITGGSLNSPESVCEIVVQWQRKADNPVNAGDL